MTEVSAQSDQKWKIYLHKHLLKTLLIVDTSLLQLHSAFRHQMADIYRLQFPVVHQIARSIFSI